jgi:hypothetical protein
LRRGRVDLAGRSLRAVQDCLAQILKERDSTALYRVTLRLYHGWYRGRTKTDDRLEIERWLLRESVQRVLDTVSFTPGLEFNDMLLCGGDRQALFDTLRRREDGTDEQKMVDTALVSDLLQFARSQRDGVALVVGDDDDLLPGVITAEAWGRKVVVARRRTIDNSHLNTAGLICRMRIGW